MSGSRSWSIERDLRSLVVYTPAAAIALVIAENFYKFHSFTLECVAFLATTAVIQVVGRAVWGLGRRDNNR